MKSILKYSDIGSGRYYLRNGAWPRRGGVVGVITDRHGSMVRVNKKWVRVDSNFKIEEK